MYVEAIRALYREIQDLKKKNEVLTEVLLEVRTFMKKGNSEMGSDE